MLYEDGKVYIKYKRKLKGGKKQEEIFKKEPLRVQLHPKMENVIRVHFKGKAPSWMKDFARENHFQFSEVNGRDGIGFSLTASNEKKYIICPFVKGQIMEWFESIGDDSLEHFQEMLLDNLEIVEKNLKHYPEEFYQYGFYHRAEEINGEFSSLGLSEELKDPDNLDEMEPKERENWESLINSLIMVRDYPIELNEDTADEEIVIDIDTTEDEVVIEIEEDVTADDDVVIEIEEDTTDEVVVSNEEKSATTEVKPKVATRNSKKDGVIAGQMLLF